MDQVRYGDVVQLLHLETGCYVKMHKKTAQIDKDRHLVSLCPGSPTGCWWKIMPLYKTRAAGTQNQFRGTIFLQLF